MGHLLLYNLRRVYKCYEQHGIQYIEFIGDGDSSVYPTLIFSLPWGFAIKKLKCANHTVKCFSTALENLVNQNPNYKGKGKLTEAICKKLTKGARSAIIMRSKESDKQHAIFSGGSRLLKRWVPFSKGKVLDSSKSLEEFEKAYHAIYMHPHLPKYNYSHCSCNKNAL